MQTRNLAAIKATFDAAGILFLDPGDVRSGGHGVRMK